MWPLTYTGHAHAAINRKACASHWTRELLQIAQIMARRLHCMCKLDSQLSLTANTTATTRSCRFMLHNIRRIRLLTEKGTQVLVQALVISGLDYCNSLLAGLPASAIRPLQLIQNAAARLVFNLNSLTLLCSSAPFTGYQWLPASVSKH